MIGAKHPVRRHRIVQQILVLAQEHDRPEGHHVTEPGLAADSGVSRTPARIALGFLAVAWSAAI